MTAIPSLSHFFDDRWEQDRIQHFYFLGTPAYRRLSGLAKHVVLKGHRGTGKTTLLRAMDWRERLTNSHLRSALGRDPFEDRVVGCFLQIKLLPVDMLDIWLRESGDQVKYTIIASYLRASWIVEICAALRGLNDAEKFATYSDELTDLRPIAPLVWGWVPDALKIRPPASPDTLSIDDVERIARGLLRYVRDAAAIESPAPETVLSRLDLLELASVASRIFPVLANFVARMRAGAPWMFRVCMDEGEFLSDDWEVAVRTLIRETDAPVYLAVSVLRSLGTTTRAVGASLSIDDREVVDLDDRPPEQMVALLNGILRARLELVGLKNPAFDLRKFLGNPEMDELLIIAVARSETREAERLRVRLKQNPEQNLIRDHLEAIGAIRKANARSRREESAGYRKKKVAGYLHLLGSVGIERPTYAGWRIAVNMADNSVRDFIRFLRYAMELWANRDSTGVAEAALSRFLALRQLEIRIQDGALDRLGREKLESMSSTLVDPTSTAAIVKLFGEISHRTDFHSKGGLARPNANRLTVRAPSGSSFGAPTYASLQALLEEAASYGYVSDLEIEDDVSSCRVNRSFARHLGFSFWKPQYETRVSFEMVGRAMLDPSAAPAKWLEPRGKRAGVDDGQPPLLELAEWGWSVEGDG